jgi:hypothetical protein
MVTPRTASRSRTSSTSRPKERRRAKASRGSPQRHVLPLPVRVSIGSGRSWRWGDPRLAFALERSLGRPVEAVRDLEAVRGVTIATVKPDVPRALAGINLQLSIDLGGASGWAGRELSFRDGVRLKLVASRGDGPGIEARVVQSGRILLGEPVTLG